VLTLLSLAILAPSADPLTLKDGDRVVWIGSTIAEREQRYGYWETALHTAFPDINFTFRNLGWSGDTVFGESRAGFDTPKEGFERLVSLTLELKPTVILVSYGTNESFEGEAGLARFEKGLEKLLDALAPAKARIVLFSPMPFESIISLVDWTKRNEDLRKYCEAIRKVAYSHGHAYADLSAQFSGRGHDPARQLTHNGMHLTEDGYRLTAGLFLSSLGMAHPIGQSLADDGSKIEPLRQAVLKKNELFFHRWRPQNETYLFGFRKHEQGKNAKEVAEFDPLVDKAEKEIERIKTELLAK
jgi:lysophospholipase L1-like esterase